MPFQTIKTGDSDLDRVQQNASVAFQELFRTDDHNLATVAITGNYSVTGLEDVIGITSGSVLITLLPPKSQLRKLTITSQGGTATVLTGDRKFSTVLSTGQTKSFVSTPDGKTYWVL